jgi:endonuclease/exonuclease/phosphatase family metal-dependent hydrolase
MCPIPVQHQVLGQLKAIINAEQPDLCCFVEIDSGSFSSRYLNHLQHISAEDYPMVEIASKYGDRRMLPMMNGKSNGFMARYDYPFERLYLSHGMKRLVYRITLPGDVTLFFGHFSLQRKTRILQFQQLNQMIRASDGDVMVLADFNILDGFDELAPLHEGLDLYVLNDKALPTFTFGSRRLALDICLCTGGVKSRAKLTVVPQPFSDHAALLVEI